MTSVKIFGAGSIGNHYAYACLKKGWKVTVVDKDPAALDRMKKKIFPSRYGFWDSSINLELKNQNDYFDIVIIGTPPDSHLKIAIDNLKSNKQPKILQIEKPLCAPDLKFMEDFVKIKKNNPKVQIFSGYNHLLTKNTLLSEKILKNEKFGETLGLAALNNEEWSAIFKAHFWLKSPKDSYLGFFNKGGGALCEHSHGLSAWLHYCNFLNLGKVNRISSVMKIVKKNNLYFDQIAFLALRTNKGFLGTVNQDTITNPAEKKIKILFSNGYLESYVNYKKDKDAVFYVCNNKKKEYFIKKTRPDDFKGLVNHLGKALKNKNLQKNSPICINKSIEIMKIIKAAFRSNKFKQEIKIV